MLSTVLWRRVLPAACILTLAACGGDPAGVPVLGMTSTPRTLPVGGGDAEILLDAKDGKGAAGTGTVTVTVTAGTLAGGGKSADVELSGGKGKVTYSCLRSADPNCVGSVRIEGAWSGVSSSVSITISGTSVVDSGTPPMMDAGSGDGGIPGSMDASVKIAVALEKTGLVAGTGDNLDVTATVTSAVTNLPVPTGTAVKFTTDLGSFASAAGTPTKTVTTDAMGSALVTLHVAGAAAGTVTVKVEAVDGVAYAQPQIVGVASMVYKTDPTTRPVLGIQSSGRETTTPIYFEVKNSAQQTVPGVAVKFAVSGVAGASVTPSGVTNSMGVVSTTLQSGDGVGIATVRAVVTATEGGNPEISATHPGTPVSGGKPSDQGLTVTCARKNLGALHEEPQLGLKTTCQVSLSDRFTNPVGVPTDVQWFTEAGTIESPTRTSASTGSGGGKATTTYETTNPKPYQQTTPLPGEPSNGAKNPRDNVSTIIAVVSGEEEFYDGSGGGTLNGKWDPGEWFVDLPEPFVDWNDNGICDGAEFFIDTERIDCANPTAPPKKDMKWNGPNGCWDSNTQIWTSIHIVWTGALDPATFVATPAPPPYLVPASSTFNVGFTWADAFMNRMSNDGAGFTATMSPSIRGAVAVTSPSVGADDFSYSISYRKIEVTESGPDGGVFTVNGDCDPGKPAPPGSTSSPVKTRCTRDYVFSNWGRGNSGTVVITGGTPQPALPDGGFPSPTGATITLSTSHNFSTPSSVTLPVQLE